MDVGLKGRACDGISSLDDDSYDASHDSRRRTTERDSSSVDGRRVMGQAVRRRSEEQTRICVEQFTVVMVRIRRTCVQPQQIS